jgi:hypothetical protein
MKKNSTETVKNMYLNSQYLYTFKGDKYTLKFFSNNHQSLSKTYSQLDMDAQLLDNTYYILVDEHFFLESLKENEVALAELEKVLAFNQGIAGYFYYGFVLLYIIVLIFGITLPVHLSSYIFYRFPFWLQILGTIVVHVTIFGTLLWLIKRFRDDRVNNVYHAKKILHYIKNKDLKKIMNNVKKTEKPPLFLSKQRVIFTNLSPYHHFSKKVVALYVIPLLMYISLSLLGFILTKTPLTDVPLAASSFIKNDSSIVSVVSTRYTFLEKIDTSTAKSRLEKELWLFDFTPYLDEDESSASIVSYNDGIALVRLFKETEEGYIYKVFDLEEEQLLYTIDKAFLNIDVEIFYFLDAFYKDGFMYIVGGEIHSANENIGSIYKVNETGVVRTFYTHHGKIIYSLAVKNNDIYATVYDKDNNKSTLLVLLDRDFNVIDERLYQDKHFTSFLNFDDVITLIILDNRLIESFYQLDENLLLNEKLRFVSGFEYIMFFDDTLVIAYGNLKSYTEYDNQFNRLNQGLDCKSCSYEEYFAHYRFIKSDELVYAIGFNHTLVFTQSNTVTYTLSRSVMTLIGFIVSLTLILVPVISFHMLLIKKEKNLAEIKACLVAINEQ